MCGGDDLTGRSMCCGSACVRDEYSGGRCDRGVCIESRCGVYIWDGGKCYGSL